MQRKKVFAKLAGAEGCSSQQWSGSGKTRECFEVSPADWDLEGVAAAY